MGQLADDARAALAVVERGELAGADALAARLEAIAGPAEQAWAAALRAHQWIADPARGRLPDPARLAALRAVAHEAVGWAALALGRRALLAADLPGLDQALSLAVAAGPPALTAGAALLGSWRRLLADGGDRQLAGA